MEGLKRGLDSIIYISCLLFFVMFLFGVLGVSLFGRNDPVGFGNIGVAMLSLYQCATLSNWHRIFYLQSYGCDTYNAGLYHNAEVRPFF